MQPGRLGRFRPAVGRGFWAENGRTEILPRDGDEPKRVGNASGVLVFFGNAVTSRDLEIFPFACERPDASSPPPPSPIIISRFRRHLFLSPSFPWVSVRGIVLLFLFTLYPVFLSWQSCLSCYFLPTKQQTYLISVQTSRHYRSHSSFAFSAF